MSEFIYPVVTENTKLLPYYLIGVGCDWEQEQINRPFGYPTHQWIHCISGKGKVTVGDKTEIIEPEKGLLLMPGVRHSYMAHEEPWIVHWITFSGTQVDNLLRCIGMTESRVYWCLDNGLVASDIREDFTRLIQDEGPTAGFRCSALVYSILMHLYSYAHISADATTFMKHSRLHPVFEYIRNNYDRQITIQELADVIHVTPQYLCTLFKDLVHCRPFEYITEYKINRAKELLVTKPEMKISDVANTVGYENKSYFGTNFRKIEGISPRSYRDLHQSD